MQIELTDGRLWQIDRPKIMGILNVTPDSFSDGGQHDSTAAAVKHARQMIEQGAAIIDVGGESTRPGAAPVSREDELARVLPVISAISQERARQNQPVLISVDTSKAAVASEAIAAGADLINDVTAGRDPAMLALAAETGVPIILMHMQGSPGTMQQSPMYDDVVREVKAFLAARVEAALAAGVRKSRLLLDPGIGFGKTYEHNLALLRGLKQLTELGYPLLLGVSRKRFVRETIERLSENGTKQPASIEALDQATAAITGWAVSQGVWLHRVHKVHKSKQAAETVWWLGQTLSSPSA